ncbi:MAG: hypothetical protein NC099_04035 [Corallococcus sp.]|nr:hypothetical protein [Bacillota bacterium]MCM1533805.1 hypothetical protein [Corallococcus sp.]
MMKCVVTVEFKTEDSAHAAMEGLKLEQETYGYKILQLGLVKKENGVDTAIAGFDIKEDIGNTRVGVGSVVGGIIGILGGPIGIALGLGVGAGAGAGSKKSATQKLKLKNMSLMQQAIAKLPKNAVVLVALVEEEEEIVFDSRVKKYNGRGKINHYNVEELENEVKEAERLAKEAEVNEEKRIAENMKNMQKLAKENKKNKKAKQPQKDTEDK